MATRIKTGLIMAVVFIGVMLLSHTVVLHIAIAAVSFIALGEVYNISLRQCPYWVRIPGLIFSVAYPLSALIPEIPYAALVYVLMVSLFIMQLKNVDIIHIKDIAIAFIFAYLISVTISTVLLIRQLPDGAYMIYMVFIIPWMSDTLAYFFGRAFGKKKLCPHISPNKTVVGAVFGVLGGAVAVLLFDLVLTYVLHLKTQNMGIFLVVGIFCSVISEIGDLSASIVKRQFGAKDYGSIFPGHGGMMDRFDSVFFVAPIIYYFMQFFQIIQ
ncbi:MAG: phosphatidate cytidylyltransferase [Eubacteriales bacterium]|jgi:phosphatidate cytidylyltransferase